jgi:Fe-S cluster assembly iron-binding protein IscA
MLKITEAAQREIAFRLRGQEQHIRVYLEKSGCAGPSFSMIFDLPRDTDDVYHINGLAYLVDRQLMQQAQFVEVDFGPCSFKITSGLPLCRGCSGCGNDGSCHS